MQLMLHKKQNSQIKKNVNAVLQANEIGTI